jgi:hypothetical protein
LRFTILCRATVSDIAAPIGNRIFRATGITLISPTATPGDVGEV